MAPRALQCSWMIFLVVARECALDLVAPWVRCLEEWDLALVCTLFSLKKKKKKLRPKNLFNNYSEIIKPIVGSNFWSFLQESILWQWKHPFKLQSFA